MKRPVLQGFLKLYFKKFWFSARIAILSTNALYLNDGRSPELILFSTEPPYLHIVLIPQFWGLRKAIFSFFLNEKNEEICVIKIL